MAALEKHTEHTALLAPVQVSFGAPIDGYAARKDLDIANRESQERTTLPQKRTFFQTRKYLYHIFFPLTLEHSQCIDLLSHCHCQKEKRKGFFNFFF